MSSGSVGLRVGKFVEYRQGIYKVVGFDQAGGKGRMKTYHLLGTDGRIVKGLKKDIWHDDLKLLIVSYKHSIADPVSAYSWKEGTTDYSNLSNRINISYYPRERIGQMKREIERYEKAMAEIERR